MPAPRRTSLSRRTTLGLLAAGAISATAGCSVDSTIDSLRPSPLPTPPAPTNPDLHLVRQVADAVLTADDQAPAAFARIHRAQLSRLPDHGHVTGGHATGSWQSHQKALVATLTGAAVRAQDPDLVRLLAAMTAAQRQLLAAQGIA